MIKKISKISNGRRIKILYEDVNMLIIDKPSGISVHPDGKTKDPSTDLGREITISDWFVKKYPKAKNVGEPIKILKTSEEAQNFSSCALPRVRVGTLGDKNFELLPRPGIVHRLDKETSGVLLLAKNQKAYEFLKSQFKDRKIKKTYVTIVDGWLKKDNDVINKPIGRSPTDFRRRLAGRGARGELREAITEYTVLKRFTEGKEKFSYLEVRPKTGRTHQIRVHMKYINHPVVRDVLYNPKGVKIKNLNRLALHAKSIEFQTLNGEKIKIESPLPKEFKEVLK